MEFVFEQQVLFRVDLRPHGLVPPGWEKGQNLEHLSFLAHLSRRLTGELIGYPWIRRLSVRRRPSSTFSNIFSSETAWPIKAKFYVEPPWEGETKVYIKSPGHMTKMAATPIYGNNPSKIFSRTSGPIFTNLGVQHRGLLPIIVYINDDPGVTLTYFTARSIFGNLGFSIGKIENSRFLRNY